jgi:hypothetical protein
MTAMSGFSGGATCGAATRASCPGPARHGASPDASNARPLCRPGGPAAAAALLANLAPEGGRGGPARDSARGERGACGAVAAQLRRGRLAQQSPPGLVWRTRGLRMCARRSADGIRAHVGCAHPARRGASRVRSTVRADGPAGPTPAVRRRGGTRSCGRRPDRSDRSSPLRTSTGTAAWRAGHAGQMPPLRPPIFAPQHRKRKTV